MLGKIKEWILNRLFKGITIDEITVNKIKTTGEETAYLDLIKLDSRTSNPSLSEGLLWFRSDLDNVYLSPDGSNAVQMLKDGDPVELKDGNYAGALVGISGTATGRAASLDNLDATVSSRLASADYVTERGTDNAALASVCTETRLARLDAAISSRSSHSAADVRQSVCQSGDPANSIGRRIYDNLDAKVSEAGGATASEVWGHGTRTLTASPLVFAEVYDDDLAADARVVPSVSGIFSAVGARDLALQFYHDGVSNWRPTSSYWIKEARIIGVVGEADKVGFVNTDTSTRSMVVNKIG